MLLKHYLDPGRFQGGVVETLREAAVGQGIKQNQRPLATLKVLADARTILAQVEAGLIPQCDRTGQSRKGACGRVGAVHTRHPVNCLPNNCPALFVS